MVDVRRQDLIDLAIGLGRAAYRVVFKQLAIDGTMQGEAAGGEIVQQEDLDRVSTYGFDSVPPLDHESVVVPGETGDVAVGERRVLPGGLPSASNGTSRQYCASGAYLQINNSGDTVAEPNAGKDIHLGQTSTKAVALDGDTVTTGLGMELWASLMEAEIVALGGTPPTMGSGFILGTVDGSATKVKGE